MTRKDLLFCFDCVICRLNTFALRGRAENLKALKERCEYEAAHLSAIAQRIDDVLEERRA